MNHRREKKRGGNRRGSFLAILPAIFLLIGCGGGEHEGPKGHHSVLEQLEEAVEPNNNAGLTSDRWIEGVRYDRVTGMELGDVDTFFVARRTDSIERFNCGECHTVPLSRMQSPDPGLARAHWEMDLHHAPAEIMNCQTCHDPEQTDSLRLISGERIAFDESYRLCAQCHATQAADWVGGAHGKRLGGWAPPRVAAPCTSCHNPHDPGFPIRFPARASRAVREKE